MKNKNSSHSHRRPLTIITTHVNADFDAIASMLAAQKLYPDAQVVFPGSQEKNLKNFFVSSMVYLFNMVDINDIDFEKVRRLVLVDTRQSNRIGKLAELLTRNDLEIHTYDHHPPSDNDIQGDLEVHQATGANVTILLKIISDKKIPISADEATIMCLGIYEDTGSFTFASTTAEDFRAAAFLLSKGANLNIISDLIARELSPEQVVLLNEMIQAASHYHINGVDIVITSVSTEKYMPDFAFLVQKLVKMENLDVIFALALMENKIYVVARSRIPEVDVGEIVSHLGGGGHAYAAAASIKGKTLAQTEHDLLEIISRNVRARRQAKDLMSAPAIKAESQLSCKSAAELLTRYSINALLVIERANHSEKLCGYITRQVIEKALFHKLEDVSVREYMTTEMATVQPNAELPEIQQKIIENKQRILPVVKNHDILGVITRTDLLNVLVRQTHHKEPLSPDPLKENIQARTRNVTKFMKERLSADLLKILETIGAVAEELNYGAYVVGGFVRDLFMYRADEDMDIVIEGDGIAFAKKFAALAEARIHTYAKFGTAVIIYPSGFKIDVASARMEYYQFPAALPVVEMSSIKLDLFRRDFTINTLAIQLNPDTFGTLIDFFTARKDIKEKTIRVLHNLSFVEDPTRVFRAIRFEQRFGFTIGKLTAGLIQNAVQMDFFKALSGRRIWTELKLIFEEENPVAAIIRLNHFGLLKVISADITLDKKLIAGLNAARNVLSWYDLLFLNESFKKWIVYFLILTDGCNRKTLQKICTRLELAPRYQKIVREERFAADKCLNWFERHQPETKSVLYQKLSGFRTELLLFMMASTRHQKVKKAISLYFTRLRRTEISLKGNDLKKMGIRPGPVYREVLQAALNAKLDGRLKTRKDELDFARDYLAKSKMTPAKQGELK